MDGQDKEALTKRLKELREEYACTSISIFEDDDDTITANIAKKIINEELPTVDSTLIYLYADCGSLRKLGGLLNCSHATVSTEIKRIKKYIIERIKEIRVCY